MTSRSTGRIRLIVHAGTSKTGTSTLQFYLNRNRAALLQAGILYPLEGTQELRAPKHQWMVSPLMSARLPELRQRIARVVAEITPDTHTIILSTEGLFNHWWDFPDTSKDFLREVSQDFDTSVWIWFREPVAFWASYYMQAMRNPRIAAIPAYGHDHSAGGLLDIPWAARHLEYPSYLSEFERVFGEGSVYAFAHARDIVDEVCNLLGIARQDADAPRENATALTAAGLDMLRIVNRYRLNVREKEQAYDLVGQINGLIGKRDFPFAIPDDVVARIRQISGFTQDMLDALHRDSHERWVARYHPPVA